MIKKGHLAVVDTSGYEPCVGILWHEDVNGNVLPDSFGKVPAGTIVLVIRIRSKQSVFRGRVCVLAGLDVGWIWRKFLKELS